MFNLFPSGTDSLRRLRERLDDTIPESQGMWSYPVVQEKCGCGAFTETVLFDDARAEKVFSKWRKEHGCPLRKENS